MALIKSIDAHKSLNSRAQWTVRVTVSLDDGTVVSQTVPEGASKGENEAISLPVDEATKNIEINLAPGLIGLVPAKQEYIDGQMLKLDGTENKSNLGANALLAVSLAIAKAAAVSKHQELYLYLKELYGNQSKLNFPTPVFNIINGGKHARNGLSFQEFMVIPAMGFSYERKLEIGVDIYQVLLEELESEGYHTGVGDEGGFAPEGLTVERALDFMTGSIEKAGYIPGEDVFLGMDVAAGSFYDQKKERYVIQEQNLEFSPEEFIDFYAPLLKKFPIIYLEDPLFESDFHLWNKFFAAYQKRTMVVGDDLVVTNAKILEKALEEKTLNSVIVKPNQVGTLTETFEFIRKAQENGLVTIVSHRSGDTPEDTFVSDLALGVGADFVKFGAPARGERVVKYNRLLDIYDRLI